MRHVYTLTTLGRTALLLKSYGIFNTDIANVEPYLLDGDGLWRVKVSTEGDADVFLDIGAATRLADELRVYGTTDLAIRFDHETQLARTNDGKTSSG